VKRTLNFVADHVGDALLAFYVCCVLAGFGILALAALGLTP
jgi:hypothetical protein